MGFIDETKEEEIKTDSIEEIKKILIDDTYTLWALNNDIKVHFSRPKLIANVENIIKITLNMNLSKNDLLSQIAMIKDGYDKDSIQIKRPLELLGKSFNKKLKKPKAVLYADYFYIYDYWKYKKQTTKVTDKKIFSDLAYDKSLTDYKEETIRKYRNIIRDYVEKEKYKNLI